MSIARLASRGRRRLRRRAPAGRRRVVARVGGGRPDLLLVVVVALGLLRGSIPGAVLGFAGGLVVDVLTLGTLGVTSLVLTLAGFWAGRYGETTGRDRRFAPVLAVGAITLLAGVFGYVLTTSSTRRSSPGPSS